MTFKSFFYRNGYANQLKRLLDREKSAINFNRHLLKKNKLCKSKIEIVNNNNNISIEHLFSLDNIINVILVEKQTFFNYIFIIYGVNISNNENLYILYTTNSMDLKTFQKLDYNSLIKIYPPWYVNCIFFFIFYQ